MRGRNESSFMGFGVSRSYLRGRVLPGIYKRRGG
nr:MAG TPA: hypothetical protein [Caudoviricetes sp.]